MRLGASMLCVCLAACGRGTLDEVAPLDFGGVPAKETSALGLELHNSGSAALSLTAEVEPADFVLDAGEVRLEPGTSATLGVRFTPSRLGPVTGSVRLHGGGVDTRVALSGRGTGASLSTAPAYSFHAVPLLAGSSPTVVAGHLTVRNAGTAGSLVRLFAPRVDGTELCVGTFEGGTCTPWTPFALAAGQSAEVPLTLAATTLGPRTWTVTFPSDDPLRPEVPVAVSAVVEPASPCRLTAQPASVHLVQQAAETLTLRHLGPGRCVIRDVALEPGLARAVRWSPAAPELPLWLGPGERVTFGLERLPSAPGPTGGVVRVEPLGAPVLEVPVTVDPATCLVASPSDLDFGTVQAACGSTPRFIALYDLCSRPVVVHGARLVGPKGAAPTEFFLTTAPSEAVVSPGQPPLMIGVRYEPLDSGPDSVALVVSADEGVQVVTLRASGDASSRITVDTFHQNPPPALADVLVMVDPSPSFVSKRPSVRANLASLLPGLASACADVRWSFAAADGAPGAPITFLRDDAGVSSFSPGDGGFVEHALAAFDTLPVGSETEACVGPAAELLSASDGGVRPGAWLSVICVTDAVDHSPTPGASMDVLRTLARGVSWSAVAGTPTSSCAIEAPDDGLHASLVAATSGVSEDVCDAAWWQSFVPLGLTPCGLRSAFYLTARPAADVEVRIDGALVASDTSAGERVWRYDPTQNAVIFESSHLPPGNARVEVSYAWACVP